MPDPSAAATVASIERPSPQLLKYYALTALLAGPFFPLVFLPLFFKYKTLRYRFDEEGVSMRWGILFRREIILNYARIQDIHLNSNLVERWLDLAKIEVQTAAGSAGAEMTIEGLCEFEQVRDYLYSRMRGTRETSKTGGGLAAAGGEAASGHELVMVLKSIAEELRAIRSAMERNDPSTRQTPPGSC